MVRTLRKLNPDEETRVIDQHGRVCFATGHQILEHDRLEFDHIKAFSSGGATEINNIAPMCRAHNGAKGRLSLFDYRTRLRIEEFFGKGNKLTLHDLLYFMKSEGSIDDFALPVYIREEDDKITIESSQTSESYPIFRCSVTGWKYFYATLPIELLDSDDDRDYSIGLQPRYLISNKVFGLFQHFQSHPVLQPSLGRVVDGRIRLFDGQHKAAAILWNDGREIECKVYIEPDVRLLNQTNISAHDNFSQTRFYSSIMVLKLGTQFGSDFDEYKNLEDGKVKSEVGFLEHLRIKDNLSRAQVKRRFLSFLYDSIIRDESNRLSRLVSFTNRSTANTPISTNALANSIFTSFLHREAVNDDMTTDAYRRDVEVQNMINLMNVFDDLALCEWNPKASKNNGMQLKLERFIRARFMKAWSELVKDAICVKLDIYDQDERSRPFYRDLSRKNVEDIQRIISRLLDWNRWSSSPDSEIDRIRSDTDREVKEWVRNNGLTVSYLLGASE